MSPPLFCTPFPLVSHSQQCSPARPQLLLGFPVRFPDRPHYRPLPALFQEVQTGLRERGQKQAQNGIFLNVVQAVSQEGTCVYAASDPRKGGEASGY